MSTSVDTRRYKRKEEDRRIYYSVATTIRMVLAPASRINSDVGRQTRADVGHPLHKEILVSEIFIGIHGIASYLRLYIARGSGEVYVTS